MTSHLTHFDHVDRRVTTWLARYSIPLLRLGLGIVFLWFGILKFIPGASPTQDLAVRTMAVLTFGLIPPHFSLWVLATWKWSSINASTSLNAD